MAAARRDREPTAVHRAAQALLIEEMIRRLSPSLAGLSGKSARDAFQSLAPIVLALTHEFGRGAAALALDAYRQHRLAAGLSGTVRLTPVRLPPAAQVNSNLGWSLAGLREAERAAGPRRAASSGGETGSKAERKPAPEVAEAAAEQVADALAGEDTDDLDDDDFDLSWLETDEEEHDEEEQPASYPALVATKLTGAMTKLVLDVGRAETADLAQADRKARGYVLVPRPGACYFCLLLATRPPVFDEDSFAKSNAIHSGPGHDRTHDHCRCTLEPVFGIYEPNATVRAAIALYKDTPYGDSPAEARNNFRVAVKAQRDAGNPLFL